MADPAILVSGGAGYIGSHTLRHLAAAGRKLVVLDNFVYGHHDAIVDEGITVIEGDMGDPELVERVFSEHDIDAVVHFAAFINVGESVKDPLKYYDNNTARPLALLAAMQRHGCKVFVLSSTAAIYGEPEVVPLLESHRWQPVNPYGWSKLMLEQILRDCGTAWGLRSACLRYFNASGSSGDGLIGEDHEPESHLIPRVLLSLTGEADKITVFGTDYDTPDGTCVRDYIHVNDLARAHALALDYLRAGGESVACNLGTGVGVSVKEIIDAAEAVTGRKVPVEYGERREGDPARLVADPGLAKEVLGWEAEKKDVREMVESAWAWMNGPKKGHFQK
jgi:UDP-glucose 4-epimerase